MKKRTRLFAIILVMSLLLSAITVLVSALDSASEGNTPSAEEIMDEALVMKVNSYNALSRGTKITLVQGTEATPYKNENGTVMVPLLPVAEFARATCNLADANRVDSYSVTSGGKTFTVTAGQKETEGTEITLSAAPEMKTFGSTSVMYIAREDVEKLFYGFYVTYDESGLIYVSNYPEFVNRNDDEELMYTTAKQFIYTDIDFRNITDSEGRTLLDDVRYNDKDKSLYKTHTSDFVTSFNETDEFKKLYKLLENATGGFAHPYIKTTQERFNELNEAYNNEVHITAENEDYYKELKWYIEEQIAYADTYMKRYANLDSEGKYIGLKQGQWNYDIEGKANESMADNGGWDTTQSSGNHSVSQMPYTKDIGLSPDDSNYGYDPTGGRLNILSNGEGCLVAALEPVALAYQITRDEKYLSFAYDWMTALCSWDHWGPGHFLNCANTARPLATAYDWLYNDFVSEYGQTAVNDLATRIYENAVYEAEISLTGLLPEHASKCGDSSKYWLHTGNWNPVCTLGMLVASLAIMDDVNTQYNDDALFVIAGSLAHYMERGMSYVTLDGGYPESAAYWGAVQNMHMITKILKDTAGTDFGLMDYPGIDTADYFGCQIEGSSYVRWNYHDDWVGSQPSHWYYLSAELYDNPEYSAIRYMQLHNENNPKATHRFDLLYYNEETVVNKDNVNFTLDYSMTSIDATVVHSSYEKNALFAGVMGGMNNVAHGQHDSGNWIYENMGVRWFVDLGRDNYNLYGNRFTEGYYRYSAEGNNTLALKGHEDILPQGQAYEAGGELVSFKNNEYGSATIIDQNSVYAGLTEYARRGMLVTNNRRTFVIQDEVKTVDGAKETFYWFAHYDTNAVFKIEISSDGKTAYMYAPNAEGEFQTLRVTLLSDNVEDLKFVIMDTHTFVLDYTKEADYSPSGNNVSEDPRDNYMKLAVMAKDVSELNMAVVVEVVTTSMDSAVGYSLVPMDEWQAEKGSDISSDAPAIYTVHYKDQSSKDFSTSRLVEGIIDSTLEWTDAEIERIECHGNVTLDEIINIRKGQNITINLNGNMLYQTGVLRVGQSQNGTDTSLTVNDGVWYSKKDFQIRPYASLRFNGVDSTFGNSAIRNEGGSVILNGSKLAVTGKLMCVLDSVEMSAAAPASLVVNNSEIKFGESLISFSEGYDYKQNYVNSYILGNSSVSNCNTGELITMDGNETKVTVNFYVSDGVKLDFAGFVLPENETTEDVTRTYTLDYRTAMSMSDEEGMVNLGTSMMPYDSTVAGSSVPMYLISETGDTLYPYVIKKVTPTFIAYKTDGTNESFYSSDIASALCTDDTYTDNGVKRIVLLSDATLASTANLGKNQELTIELSGYTLYSTGRITMGPSVGTPTCTVCVVGGKIIKTGGDGFCARVGTTLIFDGVTIESTSRVAWDNGAKSIVFNGCNVTAESLLSSRYLTMNKVDDKYYHNVIINDSTVNVSYAIFAYEDMKDDFNYVDLYVLGESKVSYEDIFSFADNAIIDKVEHNVHVEKGALLSSEIILPEDTEKRYGEVYAYADVTLSKDYSIGETVKYPLFRVVEQDGFYTVEFVSMIKDVKSTLTLYADFTVNFFIPIEGNVIDLVIINGEPYPINEDSYVFTDGGVSYYKLSVKNIAADKAAEDIEISFRSGSTEELKTFSVIKYFEKLYTDARYVTSYSLASSIVKYISTAYDYTNAEKPECLTAILASEEYRWYYPDTMPVADTTANTGNIGVALYSAQLDLGSNLKFRFDFKTAENNNGNAFTGTIYINGVKYTVEDGQCGGLNYVTVEMRAFDMYDPEKLITISGVSDSGEEFYGTYDLRAYITYWENIDSENADIMAMREKLLPFMSALYTYCTEAYSFKYGIPIERPNDGDTPNIDVDIY